MNYRFVGDHADTVYTADGKSIPVAPGDYVDLADVDKELNQALLDEEMLIDASGVSVGAESVESKDVGGVKTDA